MIIMPIISHYLTLNDFGLYGLILAYLGVFQILVTVGQSIVIQNAYFEYKAQYSLIWRRSFGLMTIAGLISAIIFTLLIYGFMSRQMGSDWIPVSIMVSIYLVLIPIDTIASTFFVLHERPLPYAICSAIVGVLAVVLNLFTIKYLKWGYLGWVITLPVSTIIMYIFYFRIFFIKEKLYPYFFFNRRFFREAIRVGGPLTPHQMSLYVLGASDRLLLEFFGLSTSQIGYYSQGYNIGSMAGVFVNGIFQALARKLQDGFRGKEDSHRIFIKKIILWVIVSVSIILFIGSLWMREIFLFLFRTPQLQKAYPIAIIVMCSYMFWTIYTFFTYPLSIKKETFSISKITLLAAVVNIIGNIILIRYYGIWAAAGVTYFSYMIFGIGGLFNKSNRQFLEQYLKIKKITVMLFFLNVFLFVIAYSLRDIQFQYKIYTTLFILMVAIIPISRQFNLSAIRNNKLIGDKITQ